MPYKTTEDLPDTVKGSLPSHASEIFLSAYNNAYENYKDPDDRKSGDSREEVAFKVAWSAVKRDYFKGDDDKWHKKDD